MDWQQRHAIIGVMEDRIEQVSRLSDAAQEVYLQTGDPNEHYRHMYFLCIARGLQRTARNLLHHSKS